MDVKRDPAILKAKKRRQMILAGVGLVILDGVSAWVMQLEPAAPTVDGNAAWTGKVVRGPLVREVKGSGTLVPEDIRWIPATTSGRVERIVLQAGSIVTPDSVILELSNPDLSAAGEDSRTAVAVSGSGPAEPEGGPEHGAAPVGECGTPTRSPTWNSVNCSTRRIWS